MIPSKIAGGSCVKEGADSLEEAVDYLDDRIINLKFIRKSGRSFTIRSDWEPVFHNDRDEGSVSFKRCVEKPDIKVEYKQAAESVAIEVNIEITGFAVGDVEKESVRSMDGADGDPVINCVIQMGYRAQFPDWTKAKHGDDTALFYGLDKIGTVSGARAFCGQEITVQILTGYSESYPPDRKIVFNGIIGTMEGGLRWEHTVEDLIRGFGDDDFPGGLSALGENLFKFVTERFIRSSIPHRIKVKQNFTNKESLLGGAEKEFMQEAAVYKNGKFEALQLAKGILTRSDAEEYGILCYLSQTLKAEDADALYGYGLSGEEAKSTALRIPPTPFSDMYGTLGGQLAALQQHYPFLRWYMLPDGNFFFYHAKDTDEDIWSDSFIKERQKEPVPLPAIYDMTPAGTRVIRCPFVSFIGPMTTVLFQSRYSIGTLTSFFYPVKTDAFLVILAKIAFATVLDNNVMELTCVDLPPGEVKVDGASGTVTVRGRGTPGETPESAKLPEEPRLRWFEKVLTVVVTAPGPLGAETRWESIVKNKVHVEPGRWPEGALPDEKAKLLALKDWNPGYFDEGGPYMGRSRSKYGMSIENFPSGIGGRTGIKVPWLLPGDKITVRHPFQPEYPEDEKVAWN